MFVKFMVLVYSMKIDSRYTDIPDYKLNDSMS